MQLGRKPHTAGNETWYGVDFSDWLEQGETLSAGTVALSDEFTATVTDIGITGVAVTPSGMLVFKMSGGSVDEVFTLDAQGVTSRDEIRNDTLEFFIVAP